MTVYRYIDQVIMADNVELIKCNCCKKKHNKEHFMINRHGARLKGCIDCQARKKATAERNKCEHGRQRNKCRDCGGVGICEHRRVRTECKECGGVCICEHGRQRANCKDCNFNGYLKKVVGARITKALRGTDVAGGFGHVCCTVEFYQAFIQSQFRDGMTWENYGEWEIDHIVAIRHRENGIPPTVDEIISRLHWTNTQPLWREENMAKGNR